MKLAFNSKLVKELRERERKMKKRNFGFVFLFYEAMEFRL